MLSLDKRQVPDVIWFLFWVVTRQIVRELPELKDSELEVAREVWKKKFGTAPQDEKEKAKQVRFLQARGFSLDVIFKVLRISNSVI